MKEKVKVPLWSFHSVRLQLAMMLCMALLVQGIMRNFMSMAFACFVIPIKNNNDTINLLIDKKINIQENINTSFWFTKITTNWSYEEQSWIHSGFYYGSLLSAFIVQGIIPYVGAKLSITLGVIIGITGTIIIPIQIYLYPHFYLSIPIRFLMGFSQGFVIPAAAQLVAKWFPIQEKSTAMALFTSGNQIGVSIAMFATARFCTFSFLGGWPLSFIMYAIVGIVFLFIWIPLASETPKKSKTITAVELAYIKGENSKSRFTSTSEPINIPWIKLYLSPAVLAICLCSFCQSFIMVTFTSYLPQYYQSIFKMDIKSNGFWSSIPFIVQMSTKFLCAYIADGFKKRKISASLITKLSNSIASFGSAIFFILVIYFSKERFQSAYVSGYNTSLVSIAPSYTATVSAYAQIYAQLASSLAPTLIGFMTKNGTNEEWMFVFALLAGISITTGIFFHIFGSARIQKWALGPESTLNLSDPINNSQEIHLMNEHNVINKQLR
ncbi:Sialin [Strongyloides ratti]|uniref:Sialin n=1 Tax=Strongyloides ratti TaxID=34506 RepID=A0A090LFF4_STRRB|nr:Sialin [Strongyloides ratti]CEF68502.1 Sialin [Strongyloides ratti]